MLFSDYEVEDPPTGSNTVRTTYRLAGQIVAVQTKVGAAGGTFYYTYTDHLGNISALSTTAGAFVTGSKARYDPSATIVRPRRQRPTRRLPTTVSPAISDVLIAHNNTGANDLDLIYKQSKIANARYYTAAGGTVCQSGFDCARIIVYTHV